MRKNVSGGSVTITTSLGKELHERAILNEISWAEALRVGITYLLSQKGDDNYKNRVQLERQVQNLAVKLSEVAQEKEEIEKKLKEVKQ